jgi:hypothetical protein
MKRLSNINESVWSDIHKRSNGDIIRKEDETTNLRDIKPVDMCKDSHILWADRDLEYKDGDCYFTFDDSNEIIKNSEWRLPTVREVLDVFGESLILLNDKEIVLTERTKRKTHLLFNKKGYKNWDANGIYKPETYYCWTSKKCEHTKESYYSLQADQNQSQVPMYRYNKCCVRLVKDKK